MTPEKWADSVWDFPADTKDVEQFVPVDLDKRIADAIRQAVAEDRETRVNAYLVEHRLHKAGETNPQETVMFVASSMERAREYVRANPDVHPRTPGSRWHWVITKETVDGPEPDDNELTLLDWDGNELGTEAKPA